MKTFCLTTMIAVFLLICSNGIQAQTTQTKLDQVELFKQLLGTWKAEVAKDTSYVHEYTSFGNAIEGNIKIVTKGKVLYSVKQLWGYDKKNDKILGVELSNSSPEISLYSLWFTSKNICEGVVIQDITHPENTTTKMKMEFKSPDLAILTFMENDKVVVTRTYTRVKK
jgi:hypothetical protein